MPKKSLEDSYASLIETFKKSGKAIDAEKLIGTDPFGTKSKAFAAAVSRSNPKKKLQVEGKKEKDKSDEITGMQSTLRQVFMKAKGRVK